MVAPRLVTSNLSLIFNRFGRKSRTLITGFSFLPMSMLGPAHTRILGGVLHVREYRVSVRNGGGSGEEGWWTPVRILYKF